MPLMLDGDSKVIPGRAIARWRFIIDGFGDHYRRRDQPPQASMSRTDLSKPTTAAGHVNRQRAEMPRRLIFMRH